MSMKTIEDLSRDYADERNWLAERIAAYKEELEKLNHRLLPQVKRAVDSVSRARAKLEKEVADHPELFVKPKSVILHGIRVGLAKGKGTISWDNADRVVELIHKHFPEQAEVLVKVTETPVKKALAQLSAADLKRLGITVTETGDEVVIKPVDGDVERLVEALLRASEQGALAEAA